MSILLSKGWNLVSAPSALADPSLKSVFTGVGDKVYHYNTGTGEWDHAVQAGPQWAGTLTTIEEGQSYWVNSLIEGRLPLEIAPKGPVAPRAIYSLISGWNMIGYSTRDITPSKSVSSYLASLGSKWASLYRYTPEVGFEIAKPGFGFSDLEIGRGYLIYLDSAGVLEPSP